MSKTVSKNNLTIYADEVFLACLLAENNAECNNVKALTLWLNHQHNLPVAQESLANFVKIVRRQADIIATNPEWDIVLARLESVESPSPIPTIPALWSGFLLEWRSRLKHNKLSLATITLVFLILLIGLTISGLNLAVFVDENAVANETQRYIGSPNNLPTYLQYKQINVTVLNAQSAVKTQKKGSACDRTT